MSASALLSFAVIAASSAGAQSASADADLVASPGARTIAVIKAGAPLGLGDTSGTYVRATIEGWLAAPLLTSSRDTLELTVSGNRGARMRASASPHAVVVAELRAGAGLHEVARQGAWVRVRRTGWVLATRVSAAPPTSAAPSSSSLDQSSAISSANATAPGDSARTNDSTIPLTPTVETGLSGAPDGERIGNLQPGARAIVTGRDRGWVRVRVEGWALERDFAVADTALRGTLSAADLRADPDGTKGRLVHWDVQVLAHQVADPLRKGLANQEPYLLAQGPGRENALLYLAIPPSLAATAREVPDMTVVTITARVRYGKSEPVGVPVLDLVTIVRR